MISYQGIAKGRKNKISEETLAAMEVLLLEELAKKPLTGPEIFGLFDTYPALIRELLVSMEGITIKRVEKSLWKILPEPQDIPDEKVHLFVPKTDGGKAAILEWEAYGYLKDNNIPFVDVWVWNKKFFYTQYLLPYKVNIGDCFKLGYTGRKDIVWKAINRIDKRETCTYFIYEKKDHRARFLNDEETLIRKQLFIPNLSLAA